MAALLAGAVTLLLYPRLKRQAPPPPQVRRIVAAARVIPAGVALRAEDLSLVAWPASLPLPGSFDKVAAVEGRPLIYPLGAGEPILTRDLAVEGSGIGLSVKIPPGMRATSVRSSAIAGVAGFIYPGSHVDVLGTFSMPGAAGPQTETVLQDVEVLTTGEQVEPDPAGKPQTVDVVTLLLDPQDSQKLLLTSTQGSIQFVLRNGADQAHAPVAPTALGQLLTGTATASNSARRREARTAPPPPPYVVEVIQGDQRVAQKFGGHSQ